MVTDGETGALPVAGIGVSCLYTAGFIVTDVALYTLQLIVDDSPAVMISGSLVNEWITGRPDVEVELLGDVVTDETMT